MIRRVVIAHWKSIEALDLELGPLTVIVGPNGSGKSNFIDALRFVRDATEQGMSRAMAPRRGFDSLRQWSPRGSHQVKLGVDLESARGRGHLHLVLASARARARWSVAGEEATWTDAGEEEPTYHYSRNGRGKVEWVERGRREQLSFTRRDELFLGGPRREVCGELLEGLRSFESYLILPQTIRTPQSPVNDQRLSPSGDNLTSILKMIQRAPRHARARDEILSSLQLVMPTLRNIRIQSLGGLMMPVFRVCEPDGPRHDFNVSQISDGTLRVLGLLTALYQPHSPEVIAMEEPEQTVSTEVLAILADAVKEVSRTRQIFVTTHSPQMVDHFDPDTIRTATLGDGVTAIQPLHADQKRAVRDHLFSLGELMAIEGLHP
ncbi:MAG: AAA family ATPase [bacterium]|nr:AAA family ATPase [bacterium]